MPRSAHTRGAAASGSRVGEWVEIAVPGRPRLSGRCGRIDAYDDRKRRYVVDLGGERVTLKGSNLKATRSARRCEAAEIESGGRIRAAEPTRRRSGRLPRSDSGDEPPPSRWRRLCFGCVVGSFALAVALYSVYEPTDPTESARCRPLLRLLRHRSLRHFRRRRLRRRLRRRHLHHRRRRRLQPGKTLPSYFSDSNHRRSRLRRRRRYRDRRHRRRHRHRHRRRRRRPRRHHHCHPRRTHRLRRTEPRSTS